MPIPDHQAFIDVWRECFDEELTPQEAHHHIRAFYTLMQRLVETQGAREAALRDEGDHVDLGTSGTL